MNVSEILSDGFDRIQQVAHAVLRDATGAQLTYRPDPSANTVAWLLWHIARGEDAQIADVAGDEEEWITGHWAERFALPFERRATGYGMDAADVAKIPGDPELLRGYLDASHEKAIGYLRGLGESDLDRVVDEGWNPPVTLGVRLVSILNDAAQHAGQAAYVKGLAVRAL